MALSCTGMGCPQFFVVYMVKYVYIKCREEQDCVFHLDAYFEEEL